MSVPAAMRGAQLAPAVVEIVEWRSTPSSVAELRALGVVVLATEGVDGAEVLEQPGDPLGAGRGERVVERGDDHVAQVVERDVEHPRRCAAGVVRRRGSGGAGTGTAGDRGERLAEHARVQRVVDELPRDLAARVVAAQTGERADGGAELREHAEVGEAVGIDAHAAGALVVAQAIGEVGEALERVAHEDPREVVVPVTPVRELPVGDRDQFGAGVHEVAGTGVALHQHDRPVAVVGDVRAEPGEREGDHGHAAAGRVVLRLPLGDLVEHVLAHRAGRAELGEIERAAGRDGAARRAAP